MIEQARALIGPQEVEIECVPRLLVAECVKGLAPVEKLFRLRGSLRHSILSGLRNGREFGPAIPPSRKAIGDSSVGDGGHFLP
jgi:hypothetical protein